MVSRITSARNPGFTALLALQEKSRLRRGKGLFVVEGRREILHALEAGYVPEEFYVNGDIPGWEEFLGEAGVPGGARVSELPGWLYSKAAYREGTEGVIAVLRARGHSLEDLVLGRPDPLIAVVESVEKPGNLGAILRSADASGTDAVIFCDPLTDIYNPNLIRASLGAVFTVPVATASSTEAIAWLKERKITIYTAQLQDSLPYYDAPMTGGVAIALGTESTGLSDEWRKAADRHVRIPMLGKLDSLNVSVSAAILLYEAVRQRQSNG